MYYLTDQLVVYIYALEDQNTQDGQGHVIKMHKTGKPLCLILSFEQFIIRRPNLQGPLFCHLNGTPVTRTQFSLVLKKALSSLQIDYGKYNTHSFRIGAATTAAMVHHRGDNGRGQMEI